MVSSRLGPARVRSLGQIPLELLVYEKGFGAHSSPTNPKTFTALDAAPDRFMADLCSINGHGLTASESSRVSTRTLVNINQRYCWDAFGPELSSRARGVKRIMTLGSPCGSGKTTAATNYISGRLPSDPTILIVSPRAQLCSSLATIFERVHPGKVHLYKAGRFPNEARICVTTLDSLVGTFCPTGVLRRKADIVIIDELSTVISHLTTSPTLASSISSRDTCFRLLLVACASADEVLCLDRDIGPLELMFVSLIGVQYKLACAEGGTTLTGRLEFVKMSMPERIARKEIVLSDIGCVLNLARETLAAGRTIAIFIPDNSSCQGLKMILEAEFPESTTASIHGTAEDKVEFSQEPDVYLTNNEIKCLVYNTAIGVGVSIETEFDVVVVCSARYLTDRDVQQAEHRVRKITDNGRDRREIYVVDGAVPASTARAGRLPTINQALGEFEFRLQTEQTFLRKYGHFGRGSALDGRLSLDRRDPLVVFSVAAMASQEFALATHGLVRSHRRHDNAIVVEISPMVSAPLDRRLIKTTVRDARLVRGVRLDDAAVTDDDSGRAVRDKTRELMCLGLDPTGVAARDPEFMEAVARGVVSRGNIQRCHMIVTLSTQGELAGSNAAVTRLGLETEIAPGHVLDEEQGLGSELEAGLAITFISASGYATFEDFFTGQAIRSETVAPDEETRKAVRDLIKLCPRRYRSLYSALDRKSVQSLYSASVNAYFGAKVMTVKRANGEVSVSINTDALKLLVAASHHYARRHQQAGIPRSYLDRSLARWPILN